jgi:hypothetical protein
MVFVVDLHWTSHGLSWNETCPSSERIITPGITPMPVSGSCRPVYRVTASEIHLLDLERLLQKDYNSICGSNSLQILSYRLRIAGH